ncbi:MAG TPA: alkaline phosphatase family protein [Kofleriaceae bacterium]|nr:alkaline phosphatase family protein [Kofleriaceae bacterium]
MTKFSSALMLGAAALLGGCANTSGNTLAACDPLTSTPAAAAPPSWGGTVFTIVMENHSRGQILGNSSAPYINELANANAVAEGYHDSYVHPSEPNYFWMVAGQNFGVLDDGDPAAHHLDAKSHLADQIELAGMSWKSYQESMGDPCGLKSHGRYAAKHNPFAYFNDINGWDGTAFHPELRCNQHVVDYSQLDVDIANNAIPRYAFITPNLDNDMHDGSIAQGDAWLSREVPKLLATDAYKKGGVIFLLWDEGGGSPASDDPPFLAISPNAVPGMRSNVDYDTSSYLKTVQNILGLGELPCAAATERSTVDSMTDLFSVPMASTTPGT